MLVSVHFGVKVEVVDLVLTKLPDNVSRRILVRDTGSCILKHKRVQSYRPPGDTSR